jgi:outer membrane protein
MKLRIFLLSVSLCFGIAAFAQQQVSLNEVVNLALQKNYDVQIVRNTVESATTNKQFANGAFLPQLNAVATTLNNTSDQKLEFKDETRNASGTAESNNLTLSAQLTWTLFDGTRMFAVKKATSVIEEQSELLLKDQMVNTIASVITNYYDVVRQKQQLKAIQEQMSVSEERVKLAERKLQVGTGTKPELLQARVDYNAQRAQIFQQESAIQQLKQQLRALTGSQLPTEFEVADTIAIDTNLDTKSLIENAENSNFGLMAARENINIANLSVRENRGNYFPTLNFNAAYNYNETENVRLINPFASVYSLQNGFNYGLTLNVPILRGFNNRRLTQQAKLSLQRQNILYQQQKTTVDVSLRNAAVNYDNAKKILTIEEETIGLAKENVFIALETFKRGVTTFIELRTAQQSLADAYNRLIAARFNAKVAETELLRLNGSLLK